MRAKAMYILLEVMVGKGGQGETPPIQPRLPP